MRPVEICTQTRRRFVCERYLADDVLYVGSHWREDFLLRGVAPELLRVTGLASYPFKSEAHRIRAVLGAWILQVSPAHAPA